MEQILFSETQKFNQWWLYAIMVGVTLLVLGAFGLLLLSKLQTEIKEDGIYLKYPPVYRTTRKFTWDQLSKVYVRTYSPLSEYGGWGFRGFHDNRAWNVSGKIGLQLVFNDGKKFLIGTNKSDELKQALIKLNRYKE